jgi:hypothetical protein
MPRKKEGLPFEVHPSPMKAENGESLLYAKPQSGLVRTLDELEMYYADKYSLRKGDMTRVFQAFMDGAPEWMAMGYRIETPIGTFAPKLRMKREVTNPDDVRHTDVELEGIDYKPYKPFEKNLGFAIEKDGFRYVHKTTSSKLLENQLQLEKALKRSIEANNGYTTVASFAQFSGLTEYSARKQLDRWCHGDNPKLRMSRISHAHIYTEI